MIAAFVVYSRLVQFDRGEWVICRAQVWGHCQDILTRVGLKLVKLGIFPKLRIFAGGLRGWKLGGVGIWRILWIFSLSW